MKSSLPAALLTLRKVIVVYEAQQTHIFFRDEIDENELCFLEITRYYLVISRKRLVKEKDQTMSASGFRWILRKLAAAS